MMKTKLQAALVSCLLACMLLLTRSAALPSPSKTAPAVPLDVATSPWLWRQQGRRGPAARRLLLAAQQPRPSAAVGTRTNEFHVESDPHQAAAASGLPVEVGFDASMRKFPKSGSNKNHN